MNRRSIDLPGVGRGSSLTTQAVLAVMLAVTAGCDLSSVLRQDQPESVSGDALDNPAALGPLMSGTIGDFECAMGSYGFIGGLMSDELEDSGLSLGRWSYDRRRPDPNDGSAQGYAVAGCPQLQSGVYLPLSTARFTAEDVMRRLENFTDNQVADRQGKIATAALYAGFTFAVLGEAMCTAAVNAGPELSRANLQDSAVAYFTAAIAASQLAIGGGGDITRWQDIGRAALVGRARSKLNKGDVAGALADARQAPSSGFVWNATYTQGVLRRDNQLWYAIVNNKVASIEPSFRDLNDPRVPVARAGVGTDRRPYWTAATYSTGSSPIPIASSEEAQLIAAEVEAATGNEASAVGRINSLRSSVGLEPYSGITTPAAVQTAVREERRRELFLEGRRLNDLYRYGETLAPFVPPVGVAFLPGKGGTYGNARCFPLPSAEKDNNPNI